MVTDYLSYTCWDNSPLGPIFMAAKEHKLCHIVINQATKDCLEQLENQYPQKFIADKKVFIQPLKELEEYFQNKRQTFNLNLALDTATNFQKHVWQVLTTIPYGQVRSYKWVAQQIGSPKSARAIGGANRANPLPIVIPCHRVINANGNLGGYSGGGQTIKRILLKLEGAIL